MTTVTKIINEKTLDLNYRGNPNDWTPLICAAICRWEEAVKLLIAAGVDLDMKDKQGSTALINSTVYPNYPIIAEMLITAGADVNIQNSWGDTALMHAAARGWDTTVTHLITAGVDPTKKNKNGKTAAHRAYKNGHTTVLALLNNLSNNK